ncbi:nucleotidyltransferase [Ruegeria sp. ANG-S4]|uniref:nucleotidyltransferase family protein n=1 Tax=Ruegeria sp. ANG-S4 TaxID=1577904 RepID=UPI00057FDBD2|nr:nucleotidyltransferase family protein [Ruegeria sp. ANG-S4]KIC40957.1 nucleotidyltransferase [Ruegeria sp. ANG-S4]
MMTNPDAVMLFAAGFGTRMGDLTRTRPKPLIEVSGRPLIDYALDLVDAQKPARAVVNVHYLADQIIAHLSATEVLVSHEKDRILDTGGGLRAALPLLGTGPVFTLNSDAIWAGPNPLRLLENAWDPDRMDALLMCIPVAQAIGHSGPGDFSRDDTGRITRGPGLIYGGAQIVKPDGLHAIPDDVFSLNALWDRIHDNGRLFAVEYPGRWCDVGHPGGVALAESLITDV